MGWMRGEWLRYGIVGLAVTWAFAGAARADVSTERSASILIFPKILYDGTFDSIIQISNTSNSIVYGHCFYVDASLEEPELPPGPDNRPRWQEVDFDIVLTKQQPTHWVISRGRVNDPFDATCSLEGTCVGGSDHHASEPEPAHLTCHCRGAAPAPIERHDQAAVGAEIGDIAGLAAGRGARIEDTQARSRVEQQRDQLRGL